MKRACIYIQLLHFLLNVTAPLVCWCSVFYQYAISDPQGLYGFTLPSWFKFPAAALYDWALLGDIIEFMFNMGNCVWICWFNKDDCPEFDVIDVMWLCEPIDGGGGILIELCNEFSDWLIRESLNVTEGTTGRESLEDIASWSDWLEWDWSIDVIDVMPLPEYWFAFKEFIVGCDVIEFHVVFWNEDFTDGILWAAKHCKWLSKRSLSGSWRSIPSTVMR